MFLELKNNYKSQKIGTIGVIERVSKLLHGKTTLLQGFNKFLPEGYTIKVPIDRAPAEHHAPGQVGITQILEPGPRLELKERVRLLKDEEFEANLIKEAGKQRDGALCEICYKWDGCPNSQVGDDDIDTGIVWCNICGISVHKECYAEMGTQEKITRSNFVCAACTWVKENSNENEAPQCHICNMKGGPLRKAYAVPASMAKWNKNKDLYKKSAFGRQIWCHSLCAIWNPQITLGAKNSYEPDKLDYNCTMVIMSNGFTHINEKWICALCCRRDKVKVRCDDESCNYRGTKKPFRFHVTCAHQAGFQIAEEDSSDSILILTLCFAHKKSEFSIRSQLKEFVELEKSRVGENLPKGKGMTLGHFARLLQMAVKILSVFGWAWRWAEWWVDEGEKWEPVVEEGQQENMISCSTVIKSTPESRCADARRCRLAAFGAALRNRDYDKEKGDDHTVLDRALRAVLHTPSLVGPLKEAEIDFIAEWLGRAYRSKDRLLGFGDDKIAVLDYGESLHSADLSPKFELGSRLLPGKKVPNKGEIFETDISEVDDFMLPMDPLAEVRGKKAIITRRKEEKKKVSPPKRIRFSKRSVGQDSTHERESQNSHILNTCSSTLIGQQLTGTEIILDEPLGDTSQSTTNNMAEPLHSPQSVANADAMGVAVGQQKQQKGLGSGSSSVQLAISSSSVPSPDTQQSPSKRPRFVVAENQGSDHAEQTQLHVQQPMLHPRLSDVPQVSISPAAANGGSGVVHPLGQGQPVKFDYASKYMMNIEKRFANQPDTLQDFLKILHTYKKDQCGIKEMLNEVSELFADHPDLLLEFTYFLPDAVQAAAKAQLVAAVLIAEERKKKNIQENAAHVTEARTLSAYQRLAVEEKQEQVDSEQPQLYMQPPIQQPRLSDLENKSDFDKKPYLEEIDEMDLENETPAANEEMDAEEKAETDTEEKNPAKGHDVEEKSGAEEKAETDEEEKSESTDDVKNKFGAEEKAETDEEIDSVEKAETSTEETPSDKETDTGEERSGADEETDLDEKDETDAEEISTTTEKTDVEEKVAASKESDMEEAGTDNEQYLEGVRQLEEKSLPNNSAEDLAKVMKMKRIIFGGLSDAEKIKLQISTMESERKQDKARIRQLESRISNLEAEIMSIKNILTAFFSL